MAQPVSLVRSISPPLSRRKPAPAHNEISKPRSNDALRPAGPELCCSDGGGEAGPSLAAVEAGEAEVQDHLEFFSNHLESSRHSSLQPMLSIAAFRDLYQRNQHVRGHHFVIHQHDHPISGVHYDLRLQFSPTSTVSWAIPYGLPGHPNSLRPNRMAIETRVHNLWNNLIESASQETGSLLIWETGEYEVLDRAHKRDRMTDDELSNDESAEQAAVSSQPERLFRSFQNRHIYLRLHGSRLPKGYTIALRLPWNNSAGKVSTESGARRREPAKSSAQSMPRANAFGDSETDSDNHNADDISRSTEMHAAMVSDSEDEARRIRASNAYPGASNSIGSIHQRHWFVTLDRTNSGFHKARSGPDQGRWIGPWEPFFVRGRNHERSVVTGRSADEVIHDEGVVGFVGRKMWRPILE